MTEVPIEAPPIKRFRVLLVDDEPKEHKRVRGVLNTFGDRVALTCVYESEEAWRLIKDRYFDLLILDVFGVNFMPLGLEVLRRVSSYRLSTRILFISQFDLQSVIDRLLDLNSSASGMLAGYVDKREQFPRQLRLHVERELESFEAKATDIEGLFDVASSIQKKHHRYRPKGNGIELRSSFQELSVELERVIRDLFGLQLENGENPRVHVQLSPVTRLGLSAAVAVNAFVKVEVATVDPDNLGHQIVIKFGPKDDARAERDRFLAYVRYGVELAQRVELLSSSARDAIGALAYSYAGTVYKGDLVSLDEIMVADLQSGNVDISSAVLTRLLEGGNWYSVRCADSDLSNYFVDNQRSDLRRSHKDAEDRLLKLDDFDQSQIRIVRSESPAVPHSSLQIRVPGNKPFFLPASSILGSPALANETAACLVHGDLHGGNVLVETPAQDNRGLDAFHDQLRTCLIDFRNAGPGPRCIDAVALESSIRLADVNVAVSEDSAEYGLLRQADKGEVARAMLRRYSDDLALYRSVFMNRGEVPDSGWLKLCSTVLYGVRSAFREEVDLEEYLSVSIRYTIRMLGFKLDSYSRLRISAWLGAQYTLVREIDSNGR